MIHGVDKTQLQLDLAELVNGYKSEYNSVFGPMERPFPDDMLLQLADLRLIALGYKPVGVRGQQKKMVAAVEILTQLKGAPCIVDPVVSHDSLKKRMQTIQTRAARAATKDVEKSLRDLLTKEIPWLIATLCQQMERDVK